MERQPSARPSMHQPFTSVCARRRNFAPSTPPAKAYERVKASADSVQHRANACTALAADMLCSHEDEPYYVHTASPTKHPRSAGWQALPVEQGRIEMPKVPRHLRRCTFCATSAIGDERHCVFDCPHFQSLRQRHAMIFRDSHDAMRSVMWHKDQKSVCALVLAIVNEAQTS